jgi:hypothetical protein
VLAPGIFAFVEVGRFNEPVRPRSVIVNNATIINRTTVINNIRHETRTIGGISRQVVVNEGPGVAVVQKATGRTAGVVPIQEAARRTPAPAAVMGKPWPSASQPKPLPSQRKEGFPPTRALEPQPKGTAPNVPSSKDGHPGDSHHSGPGGGTHPSATEHKIRDEPPGKNHEQGTRSEKGQGHE